MVLFAFKGGEVLLLALNKEHRKHCSLVGGRWVVDGLETNGLILEKLQ